MYGGCVLQIARNMDSNELAYKDLRDKTGVKAGALEYPDIKTNRAIPGQRCEGSG